MPSSAHLHLDHQVCRSLYSAGNALVRAYRPLLQPLGLTYPQYLVMLALWQENRQSVTGICERTRLDSGTVTPLLKRLEAKGVLERRQSTSDERRRVITLTRNGRALQAKADGIPRALAGIAGLKAEERAALRDLTEKLYTILTGTGSAQHKS